MLHIRMIGESTAHVVDTNLFSLSLGTQFFPSSSSLSSSVAWRQVSFCDRRLLLLLLLRCKKGASLLLLAPFPLSTNVSPLTMGVGFLGVPPTPKTCVGDWIGTRRTWLLPLPSIPLFLPLFEYIRGKGLFWWGTRHASWLLKSIPSNSAHNCLFARHNAWFAVHTGLNKGGRRGEGGRLQLISRLRL